MGKLMPYLRLMRPANIITSMADIFAGFAVSGMAVSILNMDVFLDLLYLLAATIGLYGGGIILNDVFDAEIDKKERPERPIPSGQVTPKAATLLAIVLYALAIVFAFKVSVVSGILSVVIAFLATLYDKVSKHHAVFGPLNMGLCRSFNLFLGISALHTLPVDYLYTGLIPLAFIAGITLLSRGEVEGAGKKLLMAAGICFLSLVLIIAGLSFLPGFRLELASPFLFIFVLAIAIPVGKALSSGKPADLKKAVKTGVISIVIMDSAIGAGFAGLGFGAVILLLLPFSVIMAKTFAVT